MKQYIKAGGAIDLLTKSELDDSMGHHFNAAIRDLLRGVDYLQYSGNGNGTGTFSVPYAPESGYSWSLKLVSVQLSAAGVLSVYPSSSNTVAPVAVISSIVNGSNNEAVARFSSNQVVLKDSRNLTLFCGAANILNYLVMVEQVPTEMQGKL